MTAFRIVVELPAYRQFQKIIEWCNETGAGTSRFENAFHRAVQLISQHPGIGTQVPSRVGVVRLRLKGTKYQIFYRVNEERQEVRIVAFWHTSRGNGPPL